MLTLLKNILVHRRPHDTKCEQTFTDWFLPKLRKIADIDIDGYGNWIVKMGQRFTVMHSCHIDTVHNRARDNPYQGINFHKKTGVLSRPFGEVECLGADDGAGIWLMYQLIKAEKPGLYVFHRGEERGGLGSSWIVKNTPELVNGITHCFAYDRKDYKSVITHQGGQRCCSDKLAKLFAELTEMPFEADPTGSFTDSANYTHLIPECTNISVGYFRQHTSSETLSSEFLAYLTEQLLQVDLNNLPVYKEPRENRFRKKRKNKGIQGVKYPQPKWTS